MQSQQNQQGQHLDLRAASPSVKMAQTPQGQALLMGTLMRQSNFSDQTGQQLTQQQNQSFAQQQAAYMGSAMHLGYYGNSHHQSHHSLLLPAATGAMAMMGSPGFHSGTLPMGMRGGMSHHHQQHHIQSPQPPPAPPQMVGGVFGSQQVLNQMDGGMEQASLMRDYYQQHQQQLYQQHLLNQQQHNQQASFMVSVWAFKIYNVLL